MNTKHVLTIALTLGGAAVAAATVGGCAKDAPSPTPPPTTRVADASTVVPTATKPAEAVKPKEADMTHVLSAEQAYFATPGAAPAGKLAKGSKVLLMQPGELAQVMTPDGKLVYTKIDGLDTVAEAGATHVVTKEQPTYSDFPVEGSKPTGKLKPGAKVLMLIPGSNAQVQTTTGQTVYTPADGLDLIKK